ncbi:hypothetical protein Zm00014a_025022 [Zea mays]|uniref:Uncharacterized protein n=1 Tax=Zea mays TaxID=4577 RepID=A0A3L6FDN8_MAIZE|nr:hypothetical protein Zm00014a_025022 [Zea mays]
MMTYVGKNWPMADAIKGSSERASNQSHRDVTRSRSGGPERWRGQTSGEVAEMDGRRPPCSGTAPATASRASEQSTRRSRDPRLAAAASLHTLRPPPIQQETPMAIIQPPSRQQVVVLKIAIDPRHGLPLLLSHSVEQPAAIPQQQAATPSGLPVHTFRVATDPRDGHIAILSHTVEATTRHHAAASSVAAADQPGGSGVMRAREARDGNSQTTTRMVFRTALKEFVTKQIAETRGQQASLTTEELRGFVVRKAVDNIMRSEKHIPGTQERIGKYLRFCRGKIRKLIQEYFHKYEGRFPR